MVRGARAPLPRHRSVVPIVLVVLWTGFVLVATLWPTRVDGGLADGYEHFQQLLRRTFDFRLPFGYGTVEVLANVALFVPLGLAAAWALPRGLWWVAAVGGIAVSGSVELVQQFFLPGRVGSVTDVVANGSGALIGALVVLLLREIVRGRRRRRARRAL